MMIYAANDPRAVDLDYPNYAWFQADGKLPVNEKARLNPPLIGRAGL